MSGTAVSRDTLARVVGVTGEVLQNPENFAQIIGKEAIALLRAGDMPKNLEDELRAVLAKYEKPDSHHKIWLDGPL